MTFPSRPAPGLRRRERGNTLIGIIIGLVIGLGIAVVVALAITKGATPFTDKNPKSGRAADAASGQVADPNKPMYGNKEAAREAARDLGKEPAREVAPAAVPAPAAPVLRDAQKTPPPPDALEQAINNMRSPTLDKTAPAAPAAPAAAASPKAAADDKFTYYLQVGAFREVADAESARAKLALLGFEASISDRATDNGVLHRVRMGPYNQIDAMNRARGKLSENGVDVAVVRNPK